MAIRDAPHGILGQVLGQADGANAVVRLRQPPAFAQNYLRVRVYGGPIEAQYDRHGLGRGAAVRVGHVVVVVVITTVGFRFDAGVRGEHDGGDEYENADGDGDAVADADADADAGGGDGSVSREHQKERDLRVRNEVRVVAREPVRQGL